MREMKDSGIEWIGDIPVYWKIMPNKYLMRKEKKICPVYHGEDILSLTMKGVIVRDLDAGGKMPASFDGYQRLEAGNLLMCLFDIDVTPRCVGLIKQAGVSSPAYSQFVLRKGADAAYYCYYYTMLDNDKTLLHLAKNLRHSLTEDQLGVIPVIVPPIEEQQRIADFLDTKCAEIDALTADIQTQIDTLEQYKRSVITETVTKGLDPDAEMKDSGIEWVGEIPAHWLVHPVYYYYGERKNKNYLGKEDNLLSLSYGRVVRKDINTSDGLLPESFNTYNIVETGDIIIRPTDLQNDKRSLRTGLVKEHGIITSAYIDLCPIKQVDSRYFYFLLHAYDVMKVFYNMGNGVRQGLNYSEFSRLMVFEPPYDEQVTRVLCEDDIKINGLLTNERTRYLDYLYRAFQHTNLSEISINRAIHNVENEYDRKYTERKSVLCFFAPMSLAESSGIAGYDKYCANIGGELAEWGLKENQHEVYEALRKIGIPVIVEFRMPFEQITDYAQEKIIFQFILYYAGQLFWNKKFPMQLEGMTENDVAASEIIAVHHYNKEVDYE